MKNILKLLLALFVMIGVFAIHDTASASTAKEKIYREYVLPKEAAKFPIELTNGLTVSTTKVKGKTVPIIKKGSKTVWQGTALATNSKIRFTVSKNQDTFFYHSQTVEGKSGHIDLIGINKAGTLFFEDTLTNDQRLRLDFLSATLIEVGLEVDNVHYDYESNFVSQFYQLYKDGTSKQVDYFDQAFVNLVKKGQLKWTYGAIGTTYKNLTEKANHLDGSSSAFNYGYFSTWKNLYVIDYNATVYHPTDGGDYTTSIKSNGKAEFIGNRHIVMDVSQAKSSLRSYLGSPLAPFSYEGHNEKRKHRDVFSVGKYYLVVDYSSEYTDLVIVSLMLKEMYYIFYYTG